MNPTTIASIANQRHADLVADALEYRRSHAARLPRPRRTPVSAADGARHAFSPVQAFRTWLAAGLL